MLLLRHEDSKEKPTVAHFVSSTSEVGILANVAKQFAKQNKCLITSDFRHKILKRQSYLLSQWVKVDVGK